MNQMFNVACVQTTAGPNISINIASAKALVRDAHESGANLIVLPEVTNIIEMDRAALAEKLTLEADDTALAAFCALAVELKVWLLIGSLALMHETAINSKGKPKFVNRSFLIGDDGIVRNRYTKIHCLMLILELENATRNQVHMSQEIRQFWQIRRGVNLG